MNFDGCCGDSCFRAFIVVVVVLTAFTLRLACTVFV